MGISADEHGSAADIARGIDARVSEQSDVAAEHADAAAGLSLAATGRIESAADLDRTRIAAVQDDLAIDEMRRLRLDDAAGVDDLIDDAFGGTGRDQHLAALGFDHAGIADQRIDRLAVGAERRLIDRRRNLEAQELVPGKIDGEGLCAADGDGAEI